MFLQPLVLQLLVLAVRMCDGSDDVKDDHAWIDINEDAVKMIIKANSFIRVGRCWELGGAPEERGMKKDIKV